MILALLTQSLLAGTADALGVRCFPKASASAVFGLTDCQVVWQWSVMPTLAQKVPVNMAEGR